MPVETTGGSFVKLVVAESEVGAWEGEGEGDGRVSGSRIGQFGNC